MTPEQYIANKRLETVEAVQKSITDSFIKENCRTCGSQRCNPHDPMWLEGCELYHKTLQAYMQA